MCNANFPSVWLLEQHAALQHANLGPLDEKPFICQQCGQSYRYRSAYVKHREQNHRARLPADKLFTCDVCGMQFRYLKSFKKHRLNHALERLHGKFERRINPGGDKGKQLLEPLLKLSTETNNNNNNNDMVTSSNETMNDEIVDLRFSIKTEDEDDDEERDTSVDSANADGDTVPNTPTDLSMSGSPLAAAIKMKMGHGDKPMLMPDRPISRDSDFAMKVGTAWLLCLCWYY